MKNKILINTANSSLKKKNMNWDEAALHLAGGVRSIKEAKLINLKTKKEKN